MPNGACHAMATTGPIPPGRTCRDAGGIFDPGQACQSERPANIDFTRVSGHYVSPLTISHEDGTIEEVPATDIRARRYRGSTVVDAAVNWINRQPTDKPWMATVSFASAHTPVMQPPPALLPPAAALLPINDCTGAAQGVLSNQMIEAMDAEMGRLLVETGLATRGADGALIYRQDNSNTMIIIVGDNGSFAAGVKQPFDGGRSKGTAYQTGVWVPLVIAGPLVQEPDRKVGHMVNIADLYELFGEIAGIDVDRSVSRPLDSAKLLPYLLDPNQRSIRTSNFTQVGPNIQAGDTLNGPCQIGNPITGVESCTQIPVTEEVCEDNGGIWWGAGADHPSTEGIPEEGLTKCCEVNKFLHDTAAPGETPKYLTIQPLTSVAMRNAKYKVVRNHFWDYDQTENDCVERKTDEFYEIDEGVPTPNLDKEGDDLNAMGSLNAEQRRNYRALSRELDRVLSGAPKCPGDGNNDGVVNDLDLEQWAFYSGSSQGGSSWYDFNHDGLTDRMDLEVILEHFGARCKK
jgi:hypothetical protein